MFGRVIWLVVVPSVCQSVVVVPSALAVKNAVEPMAAVMGSPAHGGKESPDEAFRSVTRTAVSYAAAELTVSPVKANARMKPAPNHRLIT